jgi:hypothetical protein
MKMFLRAQNPLDADFRPSVDNAVGISLRQSGGYLLGAGVFM